MVGSGKMKKRYDITKKGRNRDAERPELTRANLGLRQNPANEGRIRLDQKVAFNDPYQSSEVTFDPGLHQVFRLEKHPKWVRP